MIIKKYTPVARMAQKTEERREGDCGEEAENEEEDYAQGVGAGEHREGPRPVAFRHDDGRRIRGDAKIGGVAKGRETRVAEEKIKAHRQNPKNENFGDEGLEKKVQEWSYDSQEHEHG